MPARPLAALPLLLLVSSDATAQEPLAPFRNRNGSFAIDLPAHWRQVAPNEARRIGENPAAPARLGLAQPRHAYGVGPVDAWLAGDFGGPWLYVVEQQDEWHVGDDFATTLRQGWAEESKASGERHDLTDVRRVAVGTQQVEAVVATRVSTPAGPRPAMQCLDVHAPAGGSQVTLSFRCPPEQFARWEPEFRRWLATLTFARPPKPAASVGDRLWTPLVAGAIVGLVLLTLYKQRQRAMQREAAGGPGTHDR